MSYAAQSGTNFDELLKSLKQTEDDAETLAESSPDDDAVAAAAADSGVALPAGEDDDDDEDDGGEEFGKSLGFGEDGEHLVDATDLVKSMLERQEKTDDILAKAMTSMVSAMGKQNNLIKSLQSQVAALASQGRGRKAMLSVNEKPNPTDVMAKSEAAGAVITPADLLAKAEAAYQAGAITGAQANTVDVCLRNNWPIDPGILHKLAVA